MNYLILNMAGVSPPRPAPVELQWSTHCGKSTYAATGGRDVLFILSESPLDVDICHGAPQIHKDSVPRLPRESQLTEEEACKLEHQGIPREHHSSDLNIMIARHNLDTRHRMAGVLSCGATKERKALSCKEVKRQINALMSSTDKEGGKRLQNIIIQHENLTSIHI